MKRTPRKGDIVVVMRPCVGDGCGICDPVIGCTALVGKVDIDDHFTLRFQCADAWCAGYVAQQLHITGLTA